ncbi:MAG: UDP-3-O-acyl-N-acetylglucosamine deacetylase [Alphaproteobacteria bacterium]|nr:UDP-3-O-acyl-N-acetylglucosamine deacetylase [Alphaproteobacteria bacterium]
MKPTFQKTLRSEIACTGTGLHSGAHVTMTIRPAEPDTGIVFRRTDIAGKGAELAARWDNVVDTVMGTTIGNADKVRVATIEHLMAALYGCEIDNAIIEVTGPEVPAMDGSAAPFVFLIECAGIQQQDAPRMAIEILKPVLVKDGERSAALMPAPVFSIECEIDFDRAAISRQSCRFHLSNGTFKSDICRARTFGFEEEVSQLRAAGLARGGSLKNAIVVSCDGDKVLNEEGLRYEDEFVRHKALDCIGDLYLAGTPIRGLYRGLYSGHTLNNQLLHKLFKERDAFRRVPAEEAVHVDETWEPPHLNAMEA